MQSRTWDVFCRVVDNWGDIGVCWRLAADLAGRGEQVRLWMDDPAALSWMAPKGAAGVELIHWQDPAPQLQPGQVVIETFGCDAPASFLASMARAPEPPVWINLEYLSAEDYVERSHRLPSPQQAGPARGLTKWFFYPGFTANTGGLLREPGLLAACDSFDGPPWLASRLGIRKSSPDTLLVSLFCYDNPALAALVQSWLEGGRPVHVLATPGLATQALRSVLGLRPGGRLAPFEREMLRVDWLPCLSQEEFDRLLWSCDLNFVRGEDSLVRALWAGRPFIWQPYVQEDRAHLVKLEAFLAKMADAPAWQHAERAWSGLHRLDWPALSAALPTISCALGRFRSELASRPDLVAGLLAFAQEKIAGKKR